MVIHDIYIAGIMKQVKIYKHSSLLYVLSKFVKAVNNDINIPVLAWIEENNTFAYKPVSIKTVVNEKNNGYTTNAFLNYWG
jgi:hypothetical protein